MTGSVAEPVVIGATGHVGGYLIPLLVLAGQEVIAISRGQHPDISVGPGTP